jgi:hypothetical protein
MTRQQCYRESWIALELWWVLLITVSCHCVTLRASAAQGSVVRSLSSSDIIFLCAMDCSLCLR